MLPFGEYRPDAAALIPGTTTLARNVVPGPDGDYLPLPSLVTYSAPLGARVRGIIGARAADNSTFLYAGDESKLSIFADAAWTDKSKAGGYVMTSAEQWEFAQFGRDVIAASWENPLQVSPVNGAAFDDLLVSTRQPSARHIAVVNRSWVVLGNCTDAVDGPRNTRVWWLARDDATDADPDQLTQCDFEDLDTADGQIERIIGSEFGTIIMTKAIWRMTYEGPPTGYRFDRLVQSRGAMAAGSVVWFGRQAFFLDEDGFYAFDGVQTTPVGEGKVNRTVLARLNRASAGWISAAVYPAQSVVVWGIPSSDGEVSRIYLFNWKTGRWAEADVEIQSVFSAVSSPLFTDDAAVADLIMDELPQSAWLLDGPEFLGGVTTFGAVSRDNSMQFFSGVSMEATIDTAEQEPSPGLRSSVISARPVVDGAPQCFVTALTRESQGDVLAASAEVGLNLIGSANVRAQGRYHRLRVRVPGGFAHAIGVDPVFVSEGRR